MNYFYCLDASKKEQLSTLDCSRVKAESPRHCKDKSSCLKIQCMTAAAWASSLLQNTAFRRSCSHSKPQWVPSTSQYPSWCSQHKAASITRLILVLHTPLTVEKKQWCVRAPRNPENSRDEKAWWDGSKEKQKIWSYFVRMEWEIKPGEFWVLLLFVHSLG